VGGEVRAGVPGWPSTRRRPCARVELLAVSRKIAELRAASDDQLVDEHDAISTHVQWGVKDYLDELGRRDAARQTRTMVRLTWVILGLTIVNVAAVLIEVF
jgi:hypothetical protein